MLQRRFSRVGFRAAARTVAALALLAAPSTARADGPAVAVATPASVPVITPARVALTTLSATPIGTLMVVLDVLGIMEKAGPKPAATVRSATFLSPDPPKTPLFYSSLVVAKF